MAIGPRELYDGFWAEEITHEELNEDLRLRVDRAILNEMIKERKGSYGRRPIQHDDR